MNINPEYELEVRKLLAAGQRENAIQYLTNALHVSQENAIKLVEAVENELQTERLAQQQFVERIGSFFGGCGSLILKGISFGLGFFAFSMIIGASVVYYFMNRYVTEENRTEGIVIELVEDSSGSRAPKVAYTFNGERKSLTSQVHEQASGYSVGQTVSLFVNPENPNEAIIDSFKERFLIPAIFGGFGLFFLLLMVISIVVAKKIRKSF